MKTQFAQHAPVQPADASAAQVHSPRMRLTRRGRIVFGGIGAIAVTCAIAAGLFAAPVGAEAVSESSSASFGYVLPAYGDSLWSIAERIDPNADPRDLVYELVQLNNLSDSSVQANEAIAVPLRYADNASVLSAQEAGVNN